MSIRWKSSNPPPRRCTDLGRPTGSFTCGPRGQGTPQKPACRSSMAFTKRRIRPTGVGGETATRLCRTAWMCRIAKGLGRSTWWQEGVCFLTKPICLWATNNACAGTSRRGGSRLLRGKSVAQSKPNTSKWVGSSCGTTSPRVPTSPWKARRAKTGGSIGMPTLGRRARLKREAATTFRAGCTKLRGTAPAPILP